MRYDSSSGVEDIQSLGQANWSSSSGYVRGQSVQSRYAISLTIDERFTDGDSEQFGAFIPWLVINRGPLSALIHPNTGDDLRDHTQRATWMGQPLPLNTRMFHKAIEARQSKV
jgi:aromatic ring-cleaving dioxygenase